MLWLESNVRRVQSRMPVLLLAVLCHLALAQPQVALAANKTVAAAKMVVEAEKLMETAEFPKAAELFESAFALDPKPEYLWSQAHAEELEGRTERAVEHYRAFLRSPVAIATQVEAARTYIREYDKKTSAAQIQKAYDDAFIKGRGDMKLEEAKLDAIAWSREKSRVQDAEAANRAYDPKTAAKLYLAAYQAGQERMDMFLYKAAVAEDESKQFQAAADHFDQFLKRNPTETAARVDAMSRLATLHRKAGVSPTAPVVKAAPPPLAVDDAASDDPSVLAGAMVRVGGAIAVVGLGAYIWTRSQQSQLDSLLKPSANGLIHDISKAEAAARVQSVNAHVIGSLATCGVGLAAAGIGTYLLLRPAAKVSVGPLPGLAGAEMAWRF